MSSASAHERAPGKGVAGLRPVLLELLLGAPARARARAESLTDAGAWPAAVSVCRGWKALPSLGRRLDALEISLPEPAHSTFLTETRAAFLRSATRLKHGAVAYGALQTAGVDAVVFKGAAAIADLHSGPGDRTITDTDLLVRESDLDAAVAALAGAGFRLPGGEDLQGYLHFVRNSPGFAGNEALSLFAEDGSEIDLHWRAGLVDVDRILEDATSTRLYGQEILIPSATHGFLLSAQHALRNNLNPDVSVRDLEDARGWLDAMPEPARRSGLVREAGAWELTVAATAMARILGRFHDGRVVETAARVLSDALPVRRRRQAAALADLYFLQVARGPLEADLLLLRPTALRQVLAGLWRDRGGYRGLMKTFETRAHGAPLPVGTRMRRLAGAAVRLPWAYWRFLPALARARERAQGLSSR